MIRRPIQVEKLPRAFIHVSWRSFFFVDLIKCKFALTIALNIMCLLD